MTSTPGASLVKSGVGSDLYSVNAAQAAAAAALGGGGNLNNAYSAMASVPGVQTSMGGMGWDFNAAYVRGQNSYYTGYEYDGIPINRAFDNYNSSTESSLGLQELQVYTGGGPASVATRRHGRFHQPGHQDRYVPGLRDREPRHRDAELLPSGAGRNRRLDAGPDLQLLHRPSAVTTKPIRFIDNSNGAGYHDTGRHLLGQHRRLRHRLRLREQPGPQRRLHVPLQHVPRREAGLSALHRQVRSASRTRAAGSTTAASRATRR